MQKICKNFQYNLVEVGKNVNYLLIYAHILYPIATQFDKIPREYLQWIKLQGPGTQHSDGTFENAWDVPIDLQECIIFAKLVTYLLLVQNQAHLLCCYVEESHSNAILKALQKNAIYLSNT